MSQIDNYVASGWFAIPMERAEKKPLVRWKQFVDLSPLDLRGLLPSVPNWWVQFPGAGAAILLKPSGLLVVDCDNAAAVEEHIERCRAEPCNNIVLTGKGAHFYYRLPHDVPPLRRIQCGDCQKIDILADGYAIAPPSIHPSGRVYEWVRQGNLQDAPNWVCLKLMEVRQRAITHKGLQPEHVANAWPNNEQEAFELGAAIKSINPKLVQFLTGQTKPEDRSRAVWLLINTLCRLKVRSTSTGAVSRLSDESIAKVVWYGPLGEKPRERGWEWFCDEIARARLEIIPD